MIKLLCLITNNSSKIEQEVKNIFEINQLIFSLVTRGIGTASPSILNYFGLEETKKKIYFTIIPDNQTGKIMRSINKRLSMNKRGNGICFTVSISSSNKYIKDKLIKEREDSAMQNNEDQYCLIVTTVLEGYSENVMNAAKKGGATGGTIINGRSLGKGGSHFLKMNIEPEKDVILIVAKEIDRMNIMTEITNKTGIKKEAKGLCFSIPIEDIIGINH